MNSTLFKVVKMVSIVYLLGVLCFYGVSGDESISLEAIVQRLEFLENKVLELEDTNADLRRQNTLLQTDDVIDDSLPSKRFIMVQDEVFVAFTAAISPAIISDVQPQQTIKFDTVVTDVGGGYNNQTGVFVVPVSGIYLFSCSLLDNTGVHLAHNGAMLHAELIHNQRVLGRIFAHASTTYRDQGAQTVIAEVKQGDQVFVRSVDNPDLGLGGEFYSTFSGSLLQLL